MIERLNALSTTPKVQRQLSADTEQPSDDELAAEFSKLVRRAREAHGASPDQMSVLAVALSQAAPARPREEAKPESPPPNDDNGVDAPSAHPPRTVERQDTGSERSVREMPVQAEDGEVRVQAQEPSDRDSAVTVELIPEEYPKEASDEYVAEFLGATDVPVENTRKEQLPDGELVSVGNEWNDEPVELSQNHESGASSALQANLSHNYPDATDKAKVHQVSLQSTTPSATDQGAGATKPVEQVAQSSQVDRGIEASREESLEVARPATEPPQAAPERSPAPVSQSTRPYTGDQAIQGLIAQQQAARGQVPGSTSREGIQSVQQRSPLSSVSGAHVMSNSAKTQGEIVRGSRALPRQLSTRLLERVEAVLKEAVRSKDGKTLSFRIEPSDLGKIKVAVSMREGSLHARLTPENQNVVEALRDRAHELQASLRKLGLDVESVTVTVSSETSGDFSAQTGLSDDGKQSTRERHNMSGEAAQVVDRTGGNDLAVSPDISQQGQRLPGMENPDHWVA